MDNDKATLAKATDTPKQSAEQSIFPPFKYQSILISRIERRVKNDTFRDGNKFSNLPHFIGKYRVSPPIWLRVLSAVIIGAILFAVYGLSRVPKGEDFTSAFKYAVFTYGQGDTWFEIIPALFGGICAAAVGAVFGLLLADIIYGSAQNKPVYFAPWKLNSGDDLKVTADFMRDSLMFVADVEFVRLTQIDGRDLAALPNNAENAAITAKFGAVTARIYKQGNNAVIVTKSAGAFVSSSRYLSDSAKARIILSETFQSYADYTQLKSLAETSPDDEKLSAARVAQSIPKSGGHTAFSERFGIKFVVTVCGLALAVVTGQILAPKITDSIAVSDYETFYKDYLVYAERTETLFTEAFSNRSTKEIAEQLSVSVLPSQADLFGVINDYRPKSADLKHAHGILISAETARKTYYSAYRKCLEYASSDRVQDYITERDNAELLYEIEYYAYLIYLSSLNIADKPEDIGLTTAPPATIFVPIEDLYATTSPKKGTDTTATEPITTTKNVLR
ncbi:MAG: hypothetical protein LBN42_00070 [Oscillospiraceae bacterium]|jgi:hypothetical protein|nr:hypothetical protein [Oscillospiraceae bacterium]